MMLKSLRRVLFLVFVVSFFITGCFSKKENEIEKIQNTIEFEESLKRNTEYLQSSNLKLPSLKARGSYVQKNIIYTSKEYILNSYSIRILLTRVAPNSLTIA